MTLKKIRDRRIIYDGNEDAFYDNHFIEIEQGNTIEFSTTSIKSLTSIKNIDYLNLILNSCNGIHYYNIIPELAEYKNDIDLSVYFIENQTYITVISLGEFQPGRYKIYLEGIFQKS